MEPVLVLVAFLTSALTAIAGIGGGLVLISVMVQFLAPGAAVPIHGMVQLASNASRAAFGLSNVRWSLVVPYAAGTVVGAALGARVVVELDAVLFRVLLGGFILALTWMPKPKARRRLPGRFFTLGGVVTFLSMFVGATGPLSAPFFLREGLERDELVCTHATCMTSVHAFKVAGFFAVGFALGPHALLLAGMLLASTLGSWVGTRYRGRLDERVFKRVFKWLVTVLGAKLVVEALLAL